MPDALVLGAGGPPAAAWMRGVLERRRDDPRECAYIVGTSAGALLAAALAAGREPEATAGAIAAWGELVAEAEQERAAAGEADPSERAGSGEAAATGGAASVPPRRSLPTGLARGAARRATAVVAPFVPLAMAVAAPGGAVARAGVLASMARRELPLDPLGPLVDALGARFDGRLRIAATDRRTGRRVVFGAPGAPRASVEQAVRASCAAPWLFAPVRIGEREYVDGGVWSPLNLDAVPAGRGSEVLALNPTAGESGPVRAFSMAAQAAETLALTARGATVDIIAPRR